MTQLKTARALKCGQEATAHSVYEGLSKFQLEQVIQRILRNSPIWWI